MICNLIKFCLIRKNSKLPIIKDIKQTWFLNLNKNITNFKYNVSMKNKKIIWNDNKH
jgi:hypothetical protein